jgi:diguanylate cyclase
MNPSDIARATLTSLAALNVPPSPENYTQMYCEISGESVPVTTTQISADSKQPISSSLQSSNCASLKQLRELFARVLENQLSVQPELGNEIQALATQIRTTDETGNFDLLATQLRPFWLKQERHGREKTRIQEGLVSLLRLLVQNVGDMVEDDEWLHGQIAVLHEIVSNPLNKHSIADAERTLRDTIIKQGTLKQSLTDAKATLKSMMTAFIARLGDLTESTGEYHKKIEGYSRQVGKADNLSELSDILKDVMRETHAIQSSAQSSYEELVFSKKRTDEADARVKVLEQELVQVSELVREDQLTGALNRRGLDETLERELKRAERGNTAVCIAMLDIDNFKLLNDSLGHQAGDRALMHLTQVVKDTLRPSDSVGRYGGEEFIIILPNTDSNAGIEAIQRLQRSLTKNFFMHNNERVLVTFSAGVAMRGQNEEAEDIIGRADKAMYKAKKAGKNRVEAA